jgi:uncharacterized protein YgfB (UPF0149 family)
VSPSLPTLEEVAAAATAAGLSTSAAELHGSLCGWLAGGGTPGPDWPAKVFADDALPALADGSPLARLQQVSAAQFDDRDFEFDLLLPDAGAPLAERSGALFDWCRGFLGGFGLAAGASRRCRRKARKRSRTSHASLPPVPRTKATRRTRTLWSRSRNSSASPRCCCTATA